jgi:hypothetical protein
MNLTEPVFNLMHEFAHAGQVHALPALLHFHFLLLSPVSYRYIYFSISNMDRTSTKTALFSCNLYLIIKGEAFPWFGPFGFVRSLGPSWW